LNGAGGGELLIGLMNLETDMPNIKWKNKNLVIGKYLGMGSSAVVYKVHPEKEVNLHLYVLTFRKHHLCSSISKSHKFKC
jgi:hypothetical protein